MKAKKLKYRLGLDIGSNSIGWAVLGLDAKQDIGIGEVVDAGARIFSDGRDDKSKSTLAADRRDARSARRRRDRFLQRQKYLIDTLTKAGLFPEDEVQRQALQRMNPLELRALALTEKLECFQIGRALFHINQRRGFKSNRKDKSEEAKDGTVSNSVRMLVQEMGLLEKDEQTENSSAWMKKLQENPQLSFGSFLWGRYQQNKPTRARRGHGEDGKLYDVYPTREIYMDEFNKIWDKQAAYYPKVLTPDVKEKIHDIIFWQRKLKRPEVGRCMYMGEHSRTYRAMPSFQRYRIYGEVNNMKWRDANYQLHEMKDHREVRDAIVEMLEKQSHKTTTSKKPQRKAMVNFDAIKRQLAKKNIIDSSMITFTHETELREGFDVNQTSNYMQYPDFVGAQWHDWPLKKQDAFIEVILDDDLDDSEVHEKLQKEYNLTEQQAVKCANAYLVDGVAGVSLEAAQLMLEKMKKGATDEEGEMYLPIQHKAAEILATERKDFTNPMRQRKDKEANFKPMEQLPYYGEVFSDGRHIIPGRLDPKDKRDEHKYYGGVTNPTVHIALNQIRKVVNELIKRYGHPASIAIELGRELPEGQEYRSNLAKEQEKNQKKNKELAEALAEEFGQADNVRNRLRLKLWREQNEICPYTGEKIGAADLFTDAVEVDHIIPFSLSLDDSAANKVVCKRKSNRDKGERTPWDAFSHSPGSYVWDDIIKRASEIKVSARRYNRRKRRWEDAEFNNKQWRFEEDALALWKELHGDDFLARHLNDTRYIGRLAKEYLENICDRDSIDVLTGRVTSLLRGHWGLNSILQPDAAGGKNREDHRHHAVDAVVIGMTNKSMLQKISTASNKGEELELDRLFPKRDDGTSVIDPWQGFRAQVQAVVNAIKVSHRINHKRQGQLHKESAFGIADKQERKALTQESRDKAKKLAVVIRKDISAFTEKKHVTEIRDKRLREQFLQHFEAAVENGIKGSDAVQQLADELKIRHLRVKVQKTIQPIRDKKGQVYKGHELRNNWAMEIYQLPDSDDWTGVIISMFDAAHNSFQPGVTHRPHPSAKLVMRLFNNDMIHIIDDKSGEEKLMRVHKMSQDSVYLCEPQLANVADTSRFKMLVDTELCYFCSVSRLQKFQARKVHISPTGRVCRSK